MRLFSCEENFRMTVIFLAVELACRISDNIGKIKLVMRALKFVRETKCYINF